MNDVAVVGTLRTMPYSTASTEIAAGWVSGNMDKLNLDSAVAPVIRINHLQCVGFLPIKCLVGERFGLVRRTTAVRTTFPGLPPDTVLAGNTKCRFNRAVFGSHCRASVTSWKREGMAAALAKPPAMTHPLLRACWLAQEGLGD